jgi:hypothetical protein
MAPLAWQVLEAWVVERLAEWDAALGRCVGDDERMEAGSPDVVVVEEMKANQLGAVGALVAWWGEALVDRDALGARVVLRRLRQLAGRCPALAQVAGSAEKCIQDEARRIYGGRLLVEGPLERC